MAIDCAFSAWQDGFGLDGPGGLLSAYDEGSFLGSTEAPLKASAAPFLRGWRPRVSLPPGGGGGGRPRGPSFQPERRGLPPGALFSPQRAAGEGGPPFSGEGRACSMAAAAWLLLLFALLFGAPAGEAAAPGLPQDAEFTFLLPAGRRECFYQAAPGNGSMEVEYQVIGGAGLDVDFSLESPSGALLIDEYRTSDGVHTVEPTESGDYKLCFDNSFSTISEKLVFFELIFDSPQDDEDLNHWAEVAEPEEMLDIKIEDIKESIETMKSRLERSIQMQALLRAFEARDRNLQEHNLSRVNFWSAVNLTVLLLVSFLQVYLLKSLFEDKRRFWT
ncbi:transmembrane emp24 domain-containing protein 1 [Anolis carolinensis]|uniref:transmembrane emp24 domain-containing protein 1 n=1 Tax=Anolis carolinensis TaxID=28377 RepID=UPI002F2B4F6F